MNETEGTLVEAAPSGAPDAPERPIRVKFLFRMEPDVWLRQLPHGKPVWGRCEFLFDQGARDYDWLVVYNDLPSRDRERFSLGSEALACPREHTVLVTTEPSSVKTYGRDYTAQFGYVLTSQEPWALPHPHRIHAQPALYWFYGVGKGHAVDFDTLAAMKVPEKTGLISTVCSSKRQRHTMHRRRYDFTQRLKAELPELEVFGHGVRPMDDKAVALDPYRYHVVIENHIGPHHWTEKLADAFLGFTLPIYCGCPNAADYFPAESFIPIDIADFDGTLATIREAIREDAYARRLPHILEARSRVLREHNLFAVLAREITARHRDLPRPEGEVLLARRAVRRKHPLAALRYVLDRTRNRMRLARERRG